MALRVIRLEGDPILRKKSRKIEKIDNRIEVLLDDMVETMKEADGVGLAAPQVGILRRAIVVDIGNGPIKMVNPELLDMRGEAVDTEGCLSVPELAGTVKRPEWIKVKYLNKDGEEVTMEAEGLLARVICHEVDHLDGILYIDKVIEYIDIENGEEE